MATSSQAVGSCSKPSPLSQIQRSACSVPQLWPTIPGQAFSSIGSRPARLILPSKLAIGAGLVSFVRGTGAR